ncbi:MAG: c-type cytochrome [Rubrivivax sp.]|nr:c-type cytochrome [Rubrivivax sp.]
MQNPSRLRRIGGLLLAALVLCGLSVPARAQDSLLERGRYLVTTVMACGNCHTPKDAEGRPVAGKQLAGGGIAVDIPPFAVTSANITPDVETGIGAWTDDEVKRAIIHGERPDRGAQAGKPLAAIMAANFFKALLPRDLDAIVVYLRSLPAVRNVLPAPVYRAPVRHEPFAEADRGFTERDMQDPVRRGAYLATIAHCLECHTPMHKGVLQLDTALGVGGRRFLPAFIKGLPEGWKGAVSRNITAHPEQGLGGWSDAQIKRAITQAVGHDGRKLQPPMDYASYAGLRDEDLDAIVAYLRSLPAQPR